MRENEIIKKENKQLKAIKFVFLVILIFVVSMVSIVLSDKYVFPWLISLKWFREQSFFRQAMDHVTVINKTEQITVSENQNISNYTQKSASVVVEIIKRSTGSKNFETSVNQSVSGIIVTSDGLVASFRSKFFDDKEVEYAVFTQDGKSYEARIAVIDSYSDIVLLRLEKAENLPVAEFMAPEDIKTGMKTVIIGRSGFNAEISLRMGITSEWAKYYSLAGPLASSEKLQGVLFLDFGSENTGEGALIGGMAVDPNGNVIGILGKRKDNADAKFFIVPVNHFRYVIDQYLERGKIERGALGVYYLALSKETAYLAQNNFDRGALVYSPSGQQGLAVISGSSAERAGIRIGDIILSVNGEDINPDQNLAYLISKYRSRDKVELKVVRDGKEMAIEVVLE